MMMFPESDTEYEEHRIDVVEKQADGTYAITCNGWSLWCGKDCPIVPVVGQAARQYGRGIGSSVRGLFINETRVWYRNAAEDEEHHQILSYGADAADWLSRWDAGDGVWSIEMGGLGPGYEQCIHITAAEILRWLINRKPEDSVWSDEVAFRVLDDDICKEVTPVVDPLGLSGAQWGAAMNLASMLYRKGPRAVMTDERAKDRKIQVSKNFPSLAAA